MVILKYYLERDDFKIKIRTATILFCFLALTLLAFAGCAKGEPHAPVVPTSTANAQKPEASPAPTNTANETPHPSATPGLEPVYGEEKDFVISIEGMDETVTMTHTTFNFAHAKISLYIDRSRYDCYAVEGEYSIIPLGSGEDPLSTLHVYQTAGKSAQEAFEEKKAAYNGGTGGSIAAEGSREFAHHSALYLRNDAGQTCYFVDCKGGCIVLLLWSAPEASEGHGVRLASIVNTIEIIE